MPEINWFGKILVITGIIFVIVGILFSFAGKIPWLGKLPGDVYLHKKNFSFYFPITTSIIISVILSLIFWLINRK